MTREYIASANTVEEAFELACRELGIQPDEVSSREVLKLPKKGLFGKIKQQAQVKVVVEDPAPAVVPQRDEKPAAQPVEKASKAAAKPEAKPQPKPEVKPATVQQKEEPKVLEAVEEEPVQPAETSAQLTEEEIADIEPKIEIAKAYLSEIFEKMGAGDVTMEFTKAPDRTVIIHLDGDSIGSVIGKRGETLDSLQYLVCLVANRLRRREGDYVRFTMNAGNYREKREETLRALAARMAKKALKTGRPVALEPMNPYERRIIHAVVTDIEGVTSKSNGEEPNRKVIIKPTRPEPREGGRGRREGGRMRRGGRRDSEPRQPREMNESVQSSAGEAAVREPAPHREAKKLDDSVKLYGKIEL